MTAMPSLRQLTGQADAPEVPVSGITMDSRHVSPGDTFFACRGIRSHGLDYVDDALAAGCAAVVYDPDGIRRVHELPVPGVAVAELAQQLGTIADRFFASPSAELGVIGVTGTNGKTTVAWLVAASLNQLDIPCAYAGTLGYGLGELLPASMTTPDVIETHRRLAAMLAAGASHAAIEVSSHALAQHRVDGVRFRAAVFTNLSRDHLDYHGNMRAYADAKARLFLEHDPAQKIVNVDTDAGRALAARCEGPVITVSMVPDADATLVVRFAEATADGFDIAFDSAWGRGELSLPLFGSFNVENAALVLAVLLSLGIPVDRASHALSRVSAPPGRLQSLGDTAPKVLVDYAHTPDALASALGAIRNNCAGRLWCVFGCGGDRDRGKRPLMAKAAEQFADRIVITNDNPRQESPRDIIDEIVEGLDRPGDATIIEDRASAIAWTIREAADDDLVLIAGKGHESVQLIGEDRIPFSDATVAAACIAAREGGEQ